MKKSLWALALLSLLAGGCHRDMWLQPKAKVNRESDFFADGLSSRPNVPGTVATEDVGLTRPVRTGYDANGKLVREIPMAVTKELIARGKERYQIFCTHCHGAVGDGEGMIAQRGLTLAQPVASYHTDREMLAKVNNPPPLPSQQKPAGGHGGDHAAEGDHAAADDHSAGGAQ